MTGHSADVQAWLWVDGVKHSVWRVGPGELLLHDRSFLRPGPARLEVTVEGDLPLYGDVEILEGKSESGMVAVRMIKK